MIYIAATKNDFQNNLYDLQETISFCTKAYLPIKKQVAFLIDDFGDQILETCGGLEDYQYFYCRGNSIFSQIHDIRHEIEIPALIVEDIRIPVKTVFAFYQMAQNVKIERDFLRLQDSSNIYGLYFGSAKVYHKLWSIADGSRLKATHFTWQNLPLDQCINSNQNISNSFTKELR